MHLDDKSVMFKGMISMSLCYTARLNSGGLLGLGDGIRSTWCHSSLFV